MDGGVPPCPSPCPRGNRGMYAPAGLGEGLHLHESMFLLTKVSAAAPTSGPPSPHVPMHGVEEGGVGAGVGVVVVSSK